MISFGQNTAAIDRRFRDAINARRAELIAAGTYVAVTGYGTVALQGRPEDQQSIQGLAFAAQMRLGAGDAFSKTKFLDRNNVEHSLTPMQILEVWQKGAMFISQVYEKSWRLKEMDPEVTDPKDVKNWV